MKAYRSISSSTGVASGVRGYTYTNTSITVYFTTGIAYTYTYASCGKEHVERMKELADEQRGLSTYITRNDPPYSAKKG